MMNKIGHTDSCSPWTPITNSRSPPSRSSGGQTIDGYYFPDMKGQQMVPGDFMCANGGHCVYKQELAGLFGTKDIDALLDKSVRHGPLYSIHSANLVARGFCSFQLTGCYNCVCLLCLLCLSH